MRLPAPQLYIFWYLAFVFVILLFAYFAWSILSLSLLAPQPPKPQEIQKFFDENEEDIERLRKMILEEKMAYSVGLNRIGRYTKWTDKQWHTYRDALPATWNVYSEAQALTDMLMPADRYMAYLKLLQHTGLKSVSKSLSEEHYKEDFDRARYITADDDPQYRQRMANTPKQKVYTWIDFWHGNTSMGAATLYIVYVPNGAPAPPRLQQHLKGNWNLVW